MNKFKVGDKVLVTKHKTGRWNSWVESMDVFDGEVMEIKDVYNHNYYLKGGGTWGFSGEWLTLVEDHKCSECCHQYKTKNHNLDAMIERIQVLSSQRQITYAELSALRYESMLQTNRYTFTGDQARDLLNKDLIMDGLEDWIPEEYR